MIDYTILKNRCEHLETIFETTWDILVTNEKAKSYNSSSGTSGK